MRLKQYLLGHAFDIQGNVLVHLVCLQATFNVSCFFTIDLHAAAVERAKSKTQSIMKAEVISLKLTDEEVLRPGSLGSLSAYLATLKDDDMVTVVSQTGKHGLQGKQSNAEHVKERALFVEFIKEHRSPTGRTPRLQNP